MLLLEFFLKKIYFYREFVVYRFIERRTWHFDQQKTDLRIAKTEPLKMFLTFVQFWRFLLKRYKKRFLKNYAILKSFLRKWCFQNCVSIDLSLRWMQLQYEQIGKTKMPNL